MSESEDPDECLPLTIPFRALFAVASAAIIKPVRMAARAAPEAPNDATESGIAIASAVDLATAPVAVAVAFIISASMIFPSISNTISIIVSAKPCIAFSCPEIMFPIAEPSAEPYCLYVCRRS